MSNRFTDTEKYSDDWYRDLDCQHQRMWDYILLRCNHAGIWKVSRSEAEYHLRNKRLPWDTFLEAMRGRVEVIDSGARWFIPKFIRFQYGNGLTEKSSVHRGVIKALRLAGLLERVIALYGEGFVSLLNPSEAFGGIKDKNQNQSKKQDQNKKSEGETEREYDPADVFAVPAPPSSPKAVVPIGPHEALAFVRGKSVKVWKDDGVGWARLINKYGIDEFDAALESAPAESKKDFNVFEGFLQARAKKRRDAEKMAIVREGSEAREAAAKAEVAARKIKDAEAIAAIERICEYVSDATVDEATRERILRVPIIPRILADSHDKKYSSLQLETALILLPELKKIAHPDKVQTA